MSDQPPDERWLKLQRKYKEHAKYFECDLRNVDELARTGINFAAHAILLTWLDKTSVPDSEIISIARIIEENFTVQFTIELVEEANMKYLKYRPNQLWDSLSYLTWPRYASSNVIFSSCVDSIMAQNFHNKYFIIICTKLICPETLESNTNYEENLEVNSLDIPEGCHYTYTYGQIFHYLVSLSKPVLPIAIVRGTNLYENELPYVFSNPNPEAPI